MGVVYIGGIGKYRYDGKYDGKYDGIKKKTITLPELNGLSPTLESTALKIAEENGELCRAIGKLRGLNGEEVGLSKEEVYKEIIMELIDVAQTSFTMMFILERELGIDINDYIEEHIKKLTNKGYIKIS